MNLGGWVALYAEAMCFFSSEGCKLGLKKQAKVY